MGVPRVSAAFVDLAAVADAEDEHQDLVAVDLVEHSVIAGPQPPAVIGSGQFLDPCRTRFKGECADGR